MLAWTRSFWLARGCHTAIKARSDCRFYFRFGQSGGSGSVGKCLLSVTPVNHASTNQLADFKGGTVDHFVSVSGCAADTGAFSFQSTETVFKTLPSWSERIRIASEISRLSVSEARPTSRVLACLVHETYRSPAMAICGTSLARTRLFSQASISELSHPIECGAICRGFGKVPALTPRHMVVRLNPSC